MDQPPTSHEAQASHKCCELNSQALLQTNKAIDALTRAAEALDAVIAPDEVAVSETAERIPPFGRQPTPESVDDVLAPEFARYMAACSYELEQAVLSAAELDAAVAARLAELEGRALWAEVSLRRLRGRRLFRVVQVLVDFVRRPWRLGSLVGGLRRVWGAGRLPELPESLPSPDDYVDSLVPRPVVDGSREVPYPHIRVAHAGSVSMFAGVVPHVPVADPDWQDRLKQTGFDLLLVEPGANGSLTELTPEVLDAFQEASVPIVLVARTAAHLEGPYGPSASVILVEDPELAEIARQQGLPVLHIYPSVDDRIHNPIGWEREPPQQLLLLADHPLADQDKTLLAPISNRLDLDPYKSPAGPELAALSKQHTTAYTSPTTALTLTAHIQQALDITANGTPVIAPPSPDLDQLLGHHYSKVDTPNQLTSILEDLTDPTTRERISVPARRHVLTHHTRRHRFEQLLTHLAIPTNPPDRISILLATNRPTNLDHAIQNVTRQNWHNKELILILHGAHNFDTTTLTTQTNQLPYPTTIVPCTSTWTLGDCLNQGLDHATGKYITKMDDDDHYGPHHLTDLHTAHNYSNAHIVGKWANVVFLQQFDATIDWRVDREERAGTHIPGATFLIRKPLLSRFRFGRVSRGVDSELWRRLRAAGFTLYSTHRFGFIRVRHASHTYERNDAGFVANSRGTLRSGLDASVLDI